MPNDEKLEQLVRLLIRRTTEGEIEWHAENVPRARVKATDDVIEEYFTTTFRGQEIAVFERRYQGYDGENDRSYWTSEACLGFTSNGEIIWETEGKPLLWNLLNIVKESAANVDGILDSLLKKEQK